MSLFVESKVCRSRKACKDCRGSRAFRGSIAEHWETPDGLIDFACPLGLPILGEVTEERQTPIPPRPAPVARPATQPTPEAAEAAQRQREAALAEQQARHEAARPGAWERLRKGAAGLTKVALHIDRSDDDLIAERKAICEGCEHLKGNTCDLCGCWYSQKVKLAHETCPASKW